MKKLIVTTMLALGLLIGSMHLACADPGDVARFRLVWQPNTESDLAGYRVYSSDAADMSAYNQEGEVAAPETYWIIPQGFPIKHFAITAFDMVGNESQFSSSVLFDEDTTPPSAPSGGPVIEPIPAANIVTIDGKEKLRDTTPPAAPGSDKTPAPANVQVR